MEHKWWESSGTTMTCEHCGCVRYSELRNGSPIGHRRAERFVYAGGKTGATWHRPLKKEPECQREDGS